MNAEADWPAVAVVTHQSERALRRTLQGHLAVAERLEAPLIVVDNASTDGSLSRLRAAAKRSDALHLEALPRNLGYGAAANRAFRIAGERDVLLLNPDVELPGVEPVVALAQALRRHVRSGIVAPRLVDEDGAVQPSARRLASPAAMLGSLGAARWAPPLRAAYEHYLEPSFAGRDTAVGWVIGAAMMIRRSAFEAVAGFDERFFLYMEDADLCRRLNRAGWEVTYLPCVRLRHGYSRASSAPGASLLSSGARRRHCASLARYWRKHPRALIGGER